jgi:hypothetical protein
MVEMRVLETSHSQVTVVSEGYHYQHLGEQNIYGLDGNIRELCERGKCNSLREMWRMSMHGT